jgi:signal transduction histidine kinase
VRLLARSAGGELKLALYIAVGVLVGATYVAFDVLSETKLEQGTLTGFFAQAHAVVDRGSPVVVGGLLGVCLHYVQVRMRLSHAEEAAGRAEALRTRLQRVERDQAVWVVAAAVLHEVNNPLHAIGLLLDEVALANEGDPARTLLVERARVQAGRARSKLESLRAMRGVGEPDVQRVALDQLVRALAEDISPLAAEDGFVVRTKCDRELFVNADPTYVRTILENVIDNSLASLRGEAAQTGQRGDGGAITIAIFAESERAVVRVSDDGPPIEPAVRAALFEPLGTTKTRGLGLGLPIARALARAMSGDLLHDGAAIEKSFRLELPLSRER